MSQEELYHKLLTDLKTLNLPIDEVDIVLRPYSKTYYGRYFPNKQNNIKPRIFIYPYANEYGDLLHYFNILDTAIHEFIHHLQYTDPNFKRKKGVMHDTQFWKLYNHYTNRAEKYNIIDMEVVNDDI